jgi:hypothetical protein
MKKKKKKKKKKRKKKKRRKKKKKKNLSRPLIGYRDLFYVINRALGAYILYI